MLAPPLPSSLGVASFTTRLPSVAAALPSRLLMAVALMR